MILPQALVAVIPAFVNNLLSTFMDTSLVAVVSMYDLTGSLRLALGDPRWREFFIEGYLFVAAIYFGGELRDVALQPFPGAAAEREQRALGLRRVRRGPARHKAEPSLPRAGSADRPSVVRDDDPLARPGQGDRDRIGVPVIGKQLMNELLASQPLCGQTRVLGSELKTMLLRVDLVVHLPNDDGDGLQR